MSNLTDRYVLATLRELRAPERMDAERDLRALIESQIQDLVATGVTPAEAEREVLTALGDPMRRAATYSDRPLLLIGPDAYPTWRRLLILLLGIVVPILMVLTAVGGVIDDASWASITADVIGVGFSVAVQIAFWVTLVFAILDRQRVFAPDAAEPLGLWRLEMLPPEHGTAPTRGETVGEIVFTTMLIAFFPVQHFWFTVGDGHPMLDPDLWRFWIPLLIVLAVVSMVRAIVVAVRGVTLWRDVATLAALSGVMTAVLIWLAATDRLLNPAYVAHFGWLTEHLDSVNLAIILGALVTWAVEVGEAAVQAWRARGQAR